MIDNYLNHATNEQYIAVCNMWRHIGNQYKSFAAEDSCADYEMFPADWENDYFDEEVYGDGEDVFEY